MPLEDKTEEINPTNKPQIGKFRKLDIPILRSKPEDFVISTEQDFETAVKIAHAYSKDYTQSQPTVETFEQIGFQIGKDFQFTEQGPGCDTLAGQLRNNSIKNRDCKLPTFLLALAWKELKPDSSLDIIFVKSNITHPYVHLKMGGKNIFGHFTKPNPEADYQISQFELLDDENTKLLEKFMARDWTSSFSPDAQGMKAIDEFFRDD
jgi:hypothetical protein